jgi:alcohol dehydrogenase
VSARANPLTDALALSGLRAVRDGLLAWYDGGAAAADARARMAYAALVSGICLAQTGLGSVHGLASPLGAFFPIAHGVVCGTLVAEATRVNIEAMESREPDHPALAKYAKAAGVLGGAESASPAEDRRHLVRLLQRWTQRLGLPTLSALGVGAGDVDRIVAHSRGSSMKTNPVVLADDEIRQLLVSRLAG